MSLAFDECAFLRSQIDGAMDLVETVQQDNEMLQRENAQLCEQLHEQAAWWNEQYENVRELNRQLTLKNEALRTAGMAATSVGLGSVEDAQRKDELIDSLKNTIAQQREMFVAQREEVRGSQNGAA